MMKRLLLILTGILFTVSLFCQSQQNTTVSGYVYEKEGNQPLKDVYILANGQLTFSNEFGYFSLIVPSTDNLCLDFEYTGSPPFQKCIKAQRDTQLNIILEAYQLEEIEVNANHFIQNDKKDLGKMSVSSIRLKKASLLGGENDPIKFLAMLPGVEGGIEGYSQLSVRGGGLFENQYIVDGVPLYNTGHLLGFTSIFNGNIIKKVDLYKGSSPSEFGGRLSSIVDIQIKEGNKKEWNIEGDIGLLDSDILVEGPINEKTSILVAARAFYIARLATVFRKRIESNPDTFDYLFYDLNLKINHQIDSSSRIFLSYYRGVDDLEVENTFFNSSGLIPYDATVQNTTTNLLAARYFKSFKNNIFLVANFGFTNNVQNLEEAEGSRALGTVDEERTLLNASLQDYYFKTKIDKVWSSAISTQVGTELTHHQIEPGNREGRITSNTTIEQNLEEANAERATEYAIFGDLKWNISSKFSSTLGLRVSGISSQQKVFILPRVNFNLDLDWAQLKASYGQSVQHLHAATAGNAEVLSSVIWLPAQDALPSQRSQIVSLGIAKTILPLQMNLSFETFYKKYTDLSMFDRNGSSIPSFQNWRNQFYSNGEGNAYGFEVFVEKFWLDKKLNTSISYSYTRSERLFKQISKNTFPFRFVRPHSINVMANWKLGKKWNLFTAFTLNSNSRFTLPVSKVDNSLIFNDYLIYENLNNSSLPLYHRLDIGASKEKIISNVYTLGWRFGVYNLYGRKNTNAAYIDTFDNRVIFQGISFINIVPYINFFFKRNL